MGKIIIPKYRAQYRDQDGWHTVLWRGRPTNKAAEKWRNEMNRSFNAGGNNFVVSETRGIIIHVSAVRIIEQATKKCVAYVQAPMFEVV